MTKFCLHPEAPSDLVAETIGLIIWIMEDYGWCMHVVGNKDFNDKIFEALGEIKSFYLGKSNHPMVLLIDLAISKATPK